MDILKKKLTKNVIGAAFFNKFSKEKTEFDPVQPDSN